MQHTHERRVSGVRRVPVERIVDVCGASDPASAFQGRSLDVSGRGMQVRAAHLPELRAPIVVRFQEQGADVIAEGEVAWRRACASGGEFGVRFTALDSRSVQVLKALCGVAGFEDLDVSPAEPSRSWQPEVSRAETDHDTDPAPPAALGVRLHIAGLTSPLHAQIKGQGARSLEVGSQLEFLRVGRSLEVEDLAYGSRRAAVVESVDVSVDQKSRVPELLVSVRYSEANDVARPVLRARSPESQRARGEMQRIPMPDSRARTPEPHAARTPPLPQALRVGEPQRSRPSDRDPASQALPPTAPRTASPASPQAGPLSSSERARPAPLAELDSSTMRELRDDESDDERDSTPPPLPMRADRAEPPSSKSLREAAPKRSEREPEDDPEGAVADSAEALLQRLEGMLGGASGAARAAGVQVARWGGAASRGAGWLVARASRALQAPRRPALPRRRTAAPPRSSLRSSPLRQNPQLNVQRPRNEEASVAPRASGSRALLWSCLVAVVAVSLGYFARRAPLLPAAPAAARVVAAAPPAPAPAAEPSSRVSAVAPSAASAEVGVNANSVTASRSLSSSVSADEDSGRLESNATPGSARFGSDSLNGSTRTPGSSSSADEFGQGRLQRPVIYRLRLDDVGATIRGERTATGFEISVPGRRLLDSGASITRRDPRIAKVSTHNTSQGTRVSFRFRETIPGYKVRLRKDVLEVWISES
jgi:PilZ domain